MAERRAGVCGNRFFAKQDAIEFHIEGLLSAGEKIPQARSEAAYCEIGA